MSITAAEHRSRVSLPNIAEPALWGLVGRTPLIPFSHDGPKGVEALLKCEWLNPGGSVKDRAALFILRDGILRGELPRKRLLDASSGNTAIAYAMLGAAAGIGITVCMPHNASPERKLLLMTYGAEVVYTDPQEGMDGAIQRAQRLAALEPERFWYADQYSHPANPGAHFCTTAEEIWQQTGGRITHLVAGLGTTGTMTGTGRRLRQLNPAIQLVAVQPEAAFHGLEGLKYLAAAMVPEIYDPLLPDHHEFVSTEEAEAAVRRLAREAGLLVGWSTGAAVCAARRLLSRLSRSAPDASGSVVVIAPDSGARYLSAAPRLLGASV